MTKEEEDAFRGREVDKAAECLKLMHSPKTAPMMEKNLKYTHNKTSSNLHDKVDEQNLYEKINKLKSYYKSAQALIADERSRKAHRSRMENAGNHRLTNCFSQDGINFSQKTMDERLFSSSKEESVAMNDSFVKKVRDSHLSITDKELPAIKEGNSSYRPSLPRNTMSKSKTHTTKSSFGCHKKQNKIPHKTIIEAYFKDRRLVERKNNLMFKSQ